ncbi:MAG: exo-alpha-sialidase [Verrucomicrobiota bacterium]
MISNDQNARLKDLASALINQDKASILIEPQARETGYWFGGGNVIRDRDGSILICGRYRNYGDSRTGVGAGERGLELAIFRAKSIGETFEKVASFSKSDLAHGGLDVVSIEGVALHLIDGGIELFISTEKAALYPDRIASFQKPGAGVWSIDRIAAASAEELCADSIEEIIPFGTEDIGRLHCKDPWVFDLPNGDLILGYCTHPFTWSSSGTGLYRRASGSDQYDLLSEDVLRRGPVWDIAAARITERLAVPQIGAFADENDLSLYFYDSCESLRQLDENSRAVARPRGWSCEEIGGIAVGRDDELTRIESLSIEGPQFVSPHGTGCSRYVSVLSTEDGMFATWQQSQDDLSQPLVGHFLAIDEIERILAGAPPAAN